MDKEILEILQSMKSDMESMQGEMKNMNLKLEKVDNKTDKNTVLLESLNKKVETMAEVHSSFTEQLGRENNENKESVADRLEVIELAVTDTSSRVKDVQKDLSRVVRATAENWAEIVELKAIK